MLKTSIYILLYLLLLGGCGSSSEPPKKKASAPVISKELAQDKADELKRNLAIVGKVCPGLARYASDILYTSYYHDPDSGQVSFECKVDNDAKTPNAYRVHGHTCLFRAQGAKLRINKGECLSLCLDKPTEWAGSDVYLNLN